MLQLYRWESILKQIVCGPGGLMGVVGDLGETRE